MARRSLGAQARAGCIAPIRRALVDKLSVPDYSWLEIARAPTPKHGREMDDGRKRLVALVRGDHEIKGMTYAAIAASRGLTKRLVEQWCTYYVQPHIEPLTENEEAA